MRRATCCHLPCMLVLAILLLDARCAEQLCLSSGTFQALTYLKVAPWRWGVMDIRYRRVQCTPPDDLKVCCCMQCSDHQTLPCLLDSAEYHVAVQSRLVRVSAVVCLTLFFEGG